MFYLWVWIYGYIYECRNSTIDDSQLRVPAWGGQPKPWANAYFLQSFTSQPSERGQLYTVINPDICGLTDSECIRQFWVRPTHEPAGDLSAEESVGVELPLALLLFFYFLVLNIYPKETLWMQGIYDDAICGNKLLKDNPGKLVLVNYKTHGTELQYQLSVWASSHNVLICFFR